MICRAIVFCLFFPLPAFSAPPIPQSGASVTILFTHDLHSNVLPHNVHADRGSVRRLGGFSRLSTAIQQERARNPRGTLVCDGGDFSMGTLFHTLFSHEAVELRLMGMMGYDVGTLGNHEFDFKLEGLAQSLDAARASGDPTIPLVLSNLDLPSGHPDTDVLRAAFDAYDVRPYRVFERSGIRIGVFGLMGQDAAGDSPFMGAASFQEMIPAAERMVAHLRGQEQADLVVCLSHAGTTKDYARSEDEHLARDVPGIDVIVSAHRHTNRWHPLMVGSTAIVSAGAYCASLGVLELYVSGRGEIEVTDYRLVAIDSAIAEDARIVERVEGFVRTIDSTILRGLGMEFHEVIAHTPFAFETVQYGYTHPGELGLGNLITDAYRAAVHSAEKGKGRPVDVVIQPLGMIRSSFDKGRITCNDIFQVVSLGRGPDGMPGYPLITPYVTGEDLLSILEIDPTLASIKTEAHLQFSGVRFSHNPYRLPLNRVTDAVLVDGSGNVRPIEPDSLYRLCVNLYAGIRMTDITDLSHGLLRVQPRRADGTPLPNLEEAIVDADPDAPGVQEIKEWVALARYLRSFPPDTLTGLPTVPQAYNGRSGRFVAAPSYDPVSLLRSPNKYSFYLAGVIAVFLGLAWLLVRVWRGRKTARKQRSR